MTRGALPSPEAWAPEQRAEPILPPEAVVHAAAPFVAPREAEPRWAPEATRGVPGRMPPVARPSVEPASPGTPWVFQAVLLLMVVIATVVCAPIGGLASQVRSQVVVAEEAATARGIDVASILAARNAEALATGQGDLDLSLVSGVAGVREARLTDLRGVVVTPPNKARLDMSPFPAMAGALAAGDAAHATTPEGTVEVVVPVRTSRGGAIVGYAWIDWDPSLAASDFGNPWIGAFGGLLVIMFLVVVLVVGGWWLAVRPVEALAADAERLAAGRVAAVRAPARGEGWRQLARVYNELTARGAGRGEA